MKIILLTLIMIAPITFGSYFQLGNDIDGEAPGDYSGSSVALSSDGSILAIGATGNAGNSGHVRLYQWNGTAWIQIGNDIDGEAVGDISGHSVALSADGNIVAIGAPYNIGVEAEYTSDLGHVRIYQWNDSSWNQMGNDIDGIGEGDMAGYSVALSSDGYILAIGAKDRGETDIYSGHVRIYQWNGSSWNQLGNNIDGESEYDRSGTSVALSADGSIVAIGADLNNGNGQSSGHVRLYEWNGSSWNQMGNDIDGEAIGDQSGTSVALSSDGSIVAIGAPLNNGNGTGSGHVRLYEWDGSSWNQLDSDIDGEVGNNYGDRSGTSVALSSDGSIVAIGASLNNGNGTRSGHVRIFKDATSKPILNLDIFYEAQSNQTIEINATPIAGYPTNFTYQWILNGYHIPSLYGGTASSYTITGNSSYEGDWTVIVSNDIGSTTNDFVFQTYSDNDGDGLSDGRETYITFTDPNNLDSDGDTINDGNEINIHQTDPNDIDSDDDGFDDGTEIDRGFDPTSSDSWVAEYINSNPLDFSSLTAGGISLNQVKDLRVGSQTFSVDNGTATVRMYVDESGNLTDWTNTPHVLELDIPADTDTKFFRFRMD